MTDPNRLEPKNGDFVAYLDRLQEDSLEALRQANHESITHPVSMPDSAQGDVDLKKIADELRQRIEADRQAQGVPMPDVTPPDTPPLNVPPMRPSQVAKDVSVAESFRRNDHWVSRAPTQVRSTPTRRRRSNKSFLMFIGNSLMMFGIFLSIVFTNEGMDEWVAPAIMASIIGFIIVKIGSARH